MESALVKELACAGILDEISNNEEGGAIGRYVRYAGKVPQGDEQTTTKAFLFLVYQTGRHGPQNGFRLALVKEGVTAAMAVERLKAEVPPDAAECVVVKPT